MVNYIRARQIFIPSQTHRLCNRMTLLDHQKSGMCACVCACSCMCACASSSSHYLGSLQVRAQQAIWTGDLHPAAHYSPHRKLRMRAPDAHGWQEQERWSTSDFVQANINHAKPVSLQLTVEPWAERYSQEQSCNGATQGVCLFHPPSWKKMTDEC